MTVLFASFARWSTPAILAIVLAAGASAADIAAPGRGHAAPTRASESTTKPSTRAAELCTCRNSQTIAPRRRFLGTNLASK